VPIMSYSQASALGVARGGLGPPKGVEKIVNVSKYVPQKCQI